MSLRDVLDALVGSAPFERLLLARARPIVAKRRRRAGRRPGGRRGGVGRAAARGHPRPPRGGGPRPRDRCLPRPGSPSPSCRRGTRCPYEGMDPGARGRGAEGGRGRSPPLRRRSVRGRGAVPGRDAGDSRRRWAPCLRCSWPRASSWRPTRSRSASSDLGYVRVDVVEHRGEFAVRGGVVDVFPGIARRPARLEYWGDEIERVREFSPSTQLSTEQLGGDRGRARSRELLPDDDVRARRGRRAPRTRRPVPRPAAAHGRRPALRGRWRRSRRSCSTICPPRRSSCPPALGRRDPRAAHVPTRRAGARRGGGARRGDRVAGAEGALADRRGDRRPRAAPPDGVHRGDRPRHSRAWGTAAGERRRAGAPTRASCGGRHEGRARRPRPRLARARRRGPGGPCRSNAVEAPLTSRGSSPRPRVSRWPPRRTLRLPPAHARPRPASRSRATGAVADELEPGDFAVHRIHGVGRYGGVVHRELAGAERDYLVLEYAGGDKLYVPTDAVGHGRPVHRRRRAAPACGWAGRIGRGRPRKVKRAVTRHGRRAGPALHGADVGPGARVRPGHAVAARARGRLPARGDGRPGHA